jgi:DNA-binding response OmpR family regulator
MPDVILIVDDDRSLLASLGEALSTAETTPLLATGAEALEETTTRGLLPDVVVIDLDMRDGPLVLERLERQLTDLVPIVALSSAPRRLLAAGIAGAVVMKPFDASHLRWCVHHACEAPRGAL